MAEKTPTFTFQYLSGKKFESLESKDNQELFGKWSLKGRMKAQLFAFDQRFQPYQKDEFVYDFLRDPNVTVNLQVVSSSGKWGPIGLEAKVVTAEPVPCTVLSMSFFDRLYDNNIVRESGQICKCFDDFYESFTIADELRKMLLLDDSDNYCAFSDSDRDEFLFQLFKFVCLGGEVCQYEDSVEAYLNTTKQLYKDLISVQKNPETKELNIVSSVFRITASTDSGVYYPSDVPHEQTFSFLVVDPLKGHAIVFYHKFGGGCF
ncbi:hypothetical protein ScPMuIL_018338 [Solemya velum]